jgi:predicted esterase
VIDPVDKEDAPGPYHCVITNHCGEVRSRNVYLLLYGQGIGDNQDFPVKVFPNPASRLVTISIQGAIPMPAGLKLFNLGGEKLRETEFNQQTILDISSLSAGIYILEFVLQGQVIHKRLMVY